MDHRCRREESVLCGFCFSISGQEWPAFFRSIRRPSSAGVHGALVPPVRLPRLKPLEGAAVAVDRPRLPRFLLGDSCGPDGSVELLSEIFKGDIAARESTTSGRNVKRYACRGPWGWMRRTPRPKISWVWSGATAAPNLTGVRVPLVHPPEEMFSSTRARLLPAAFFERGPQFRLFLDRPCAPGCRPSAGRDPSSTEPSSAARARFLLTLSWRRWC